MTKKAKVAKRPPLYVFAAAWTAFIVVGLVGGAMYGYYHRAPEVAATDGLTVIGGTVGGPVYKYDPSLIRHNPDAPPYDPTNDRNTAAAMAQAACRAPAPDITCPPPPKQIHRPISHRAPSIVRSPVWYLHNPQVWE